MNRALTFTTSGVGGSPGLGGGVGSPSGGTAATPSPALTGAYLASLHRGFAELAGRTFELRIERVLDPLVYMPEDPQEIVPGVGFPMRYGMRSLRMLLREQDTLKGTKITKKGKTVVEFDVSFLDDDFSLSINSSPQSQRLNPLADTMTYFVNVRDTSLLRCPMYSHERGIIQQGVCERELESAVHSLVQSQLTEILSGLVKDVPAPQFFNAEGAATISTQLTGQSKFQALGRVTLFGQYNPEE